MYLSSFFLKQNKNKKKVVTKNERKLFSFRCSLLHFRISIRLFNPSSTRRKTIFNVVLLDARSQIKLILSFLGGEDIQRKWMNNMEREGGVFCDAVSWGGFGPNILGAHSHVVRVSKLLNLVGSSGLVGFRL